MSDWNLDEIQAKARERRREALEMARGGKSYRAIAEAWNISITRVGAIIAAAKRDEAQQKGD